MILDNKLNFNNHLSERISKANKGIGIIRRLCKFLQRPSLINIYKTFVSPHLDYGDIICDNSSNATFSQMIESGPAEVWADMCCLVLSIFLFLSFVCFVTYIFRLNKV